MMYLKGSKSKDERQELGPCRVAKVCACKCLKLKINRKKYIYADVADSLTKHRIQYEGWVHQELPVEPQSDGGSRVEKRGGPVMRAFRRGLTRHVWHVRHILRVRSDGWHGHVSVVASIGGYGAESVVEILVVLLVDQARAPRAVHVIPIEVPTATIRSWL